ncbi:MAG: AAC(3) family N-acetyltransferase, partial [Victivallaceae bacterium]|nr:AAC(3) family N-acetyltransferase [Victivallaceae bacterium]
KRRVSTRRSLLGDLRRAGIASGDAVMVHASVKSLGIIDGGAASFIGALQDAVTGDGILAMPALSDAVDDGVGYEYDPETTPIVKWIGVLPKLFWKFPDVVRSACPTHSVLAWGRDARNFISQTNPYDCFAPDGPWAKLRDRNGKILLVGSRSIDSNTFIHACESWYATYMESVMVRVLGSGSHAEVNYPGGCRGGWYHLGRLAPYFQMIERDGLVCDVKIGDADVVLIEAGRLAEAMKSYLADDPALLLHKSGCGNCAKTRSRIRPDR